MKVTIKDIAKLANVSTATVSNVLNEKSGISEKTRKKVLDIAKKWNYQPDLVARSLSAKESRVIGLVIKEIDNPYFSKLMKGVYDACSELGYTVVLGSSEFCRERELQAIRTLTSQRVDGLIISPLKGEGVDYTYLVDLKRTDLAHVLIGTVQNFNTNVVDVDNEKAAFEAVTYLIELGHTKIAYLQGPSYSIHSENSLNGYQRAFHEKSLPIPTGNIIKAGSSIEDGYKVGHELFKSNCDKPTAIFAFNDLLAIGFMDALDELNIKVPDDISVVGYDDIEMSKHLPVPLTTVRVPAYEIGFNSARLLIEQIKKETPAPKKVILDATLIERDTCKNIKI